MISPAMATMLAFVVTDAPMSRAGLQDALREAADGSFNMISVDGDMSTNDSVYAFARPGNGEATPGFRAALAALCRDLAVAMVRDGEGATKTLVFNVTGAKDEAQARTIARAVINSSLVKTALYGEDPNWGRVIAAAGAARAGLDRRKVVAQTRRAAVGRPRRDRSAERSRSALAARRTDDRDHARPRHRRRRPRPAGAATSPPITSASTRTTGRESRRCTLRPINGVKRSDTFRFRAGRVW